MEEDVQDGIGKLAPRKVKDIEGIQAEYPKWRRILSVSTSCPFSTR